MKSIYHYIKETLSFCAHFSFLILFFIGNIFLTKITILLINYFRKLK